MNTLGGYRLVRKLGAGARSEVWLGRDESATAAIKVYRPGVDPERVDSEIEALARASSRHLVRLDDLTTGPDGMPCLILQRLSPQSLGRLLANRQPLSGEAVTILGPLALAVAELHRVGVAHGAVRPSAVLFDEAGAPVLASFGSAELFGDLPEEPASASLPPALLAREASVARDLDGLVNLCLATLGSSGDDVTRWLAREREHDPCTFPSELADRLFSLASATPVSMFDGEPRSTHDSMLARVGTVSDVVPDPEPSDAFDPADPAAEVGAFRGALPNALSLLHIPDSVTSPVLAWFNGAASHWSGSAIRKWISAHVGPVRKPVWIVAGSVAVAIVAFTAFNPGHVASDTGGGDQVAPPRSSPSDRQFLADSSIAGDDPIAAGQALLRARAECFKAESVLCLEGVDQVGSSAMEADSYQIRLRQSGGVPHQSLESIVDASSTSGTAGRLDIVERLGDTVLLSLTMGEGDASPTTRASSVSLLILRGHDGWRIRDLVVSDQPAN